MDRGRDETFVRTTANLFQVPGARLSRDDDDLWNPHPKREHQCPNPTTFLLV